MSNHELDATTKVRNLDEKGVLTPEELALQEEVAKTDKKFGEDFPNYWPNIMAGITLGSLGYPPYDNGSDEISGVPGKDHEYFGLDGRNGSPSLEYWYPDGPTIDGGDIVPR